MNQFAGWFIAAYVVSIVVFVLVVILRPRAKTEETTLESVAPDLISRD